MMKNHSDIIIIGAGIAGLVCALEALKNGKSVLLVDAQDRTKMGGLARVAFGGMALVGTPEQKSKGINDSAEIAYKDWCSFAEFDDEHDHWPKQWAKHYVENSICEIYEYIRDLDIKFLPAVNWVERGLYTPGNSLPRYHVLWGASLRLVNQLVEQLKVYENNLLNFQFNTTAEMLITENKRAENKIAEQKTVVGCVIKDKDGKQQELYADNTVIATGGFTGNLDKVREVWPVDDWGTPQTNLLNGTHPSNNGKMHDRVEELGGQLTNMHNMWNYAAGIPNPKPDFDNHGLSLIPCHSALWVDDKGSRIGLEPLVTGFDTHHMCRQINRLQIPHSWQILNWRIALREFAVSGCEHNQSIRDRKFFSFLKNIVFGNKELVEQMLSESDDFIIADDLPQLISKMNEHVPENQIISKVLSATVNDFDNMMKRDKKLWNDDQVRRILSLRTWLPDRLRTCYPKALQDHGPLIAIKLNLITRKCLGGIKTNLHSQVLNELEQPIEGLLAIGEASGFGGGGASGKRSLEGTFLSGCILTARQAARFLS